MVVLYSVDHWIRWNCLRAVVDYYATVQTVSTIWKAQPRKRKGVDDASNEFRGREGESC